MEMRQGWKDVYTMAGATIHAVIMKTQEFDAQALIREENALKIVEMVIT